MVLFDIDCDGNTVQEFLNQLKIFKSNLGDSGHTADGDIFHACETAQSMGALVIPAHIDEFSGLSDDTVVKAVIQPLSGLRLAGMVSGSLIAFQGNASNAPVEGGIVGAHVIPEHSVEL